MKLIIFGQRFSVAYAELPDATAAFVVSDRPRGLCVRALNNAAATDGFSRLDI